MTTKVFLTCSVILAFLMLPAITMGQLNMGGMPRSFIQALSPETRNIIRLDPPDTAILHHEDAAAPLPYRFAVNLPTDADIHSSGNWTLADDGTHIWRLTIYAPGALALTLYFDRFQFPEQGRLFVYSYDRTQLLGAFSGINNNRQHTFATALVAGDKVTLEYDIIGNDILPDLHLSEVSYVYRGVPVEPGTRTGFGSAGKCEVNVKCSEGDSWELQKKGVARVQVKRGAGSFWCTGSLINNTRNDGTPYFLTADHCGRYSSATDLSQWLFYFNYQSSKCVNPLLEPRPQTLTGATFVSHGGNGGDTGSDFYLVLLNNTIPDTFQVYYNGWSRETTPSPSGVCLHHPQGDIKKISTYTSPLQPSSWNGNGVISHWRTTWVATTHGHGTTEGGSSGSPLLDPLGRVVGTLTGGESSCDSSDLNLPDYFGMFSYHWDQNGSDSASVLKYWLDPGNSDVMTLNGWAVGVNELNTEPEILVFPNPVTDHLEVAGSGIRLGKHWSLTVTNILGVILFQQIGLDGIKQKINTSGWTPGIYLLRVTDGKTLSVKKIIKQ
ncbi:MAG: T9SS type A sorting domain-containing protein [Bacteroidales bacterium]|nr:T9SS type A sorting domain-containing protein [Bacteroidales bacterium]